MSSVQQLRRSDLGLFLNQFAWAHAVHLTTGKPTSPRAIVRSFADSFIRCLARATRQPVPYFYAIEQQIGGFPHLHGLIGGTDSLSAKEVQARWKIGLSRVHRYSSSRGAAYYVSKSVLDAPDDYDISKRMPPLIMTVL